ncbi:uncharacterized protein LOC102704861 [Oryza brachyantha]|uniref:uncharacterized protein LOC102704861 n=1 Tax=Oryza brachyantha TaxID=4533 RepID=UPI001ADB9164|nr:uncharacterized protein LOC102704861 [Oryza brachyantha]
MAQLQPRRRWRSSLASGFRAALACTIVGVASIYAPPAIRCHLTFPAFSYVVTVIIVVDATLGSAVRAALSAVQATAMGAVPSVLPLWLAHRTGAGESVVATTVVVALSTFAVALPGSGAVAKRIALGQIIIIYVARFRQESMRRSDGDGAVLLHPANVVACTALGVVAALLAVLLPCPRLATQEVRANKAAYLEIAAERVRLLAHAFRLMQLDAAAGSSSSTYCCGRRRQWVAACIISQADRAASAAALLRRRITSAQGDLQWERMPALLKRWCRGGWDDDEEDQQVHDLIEMPLRGMEMACIQMQMQKRAPNSSSSICPTPTLTWLQQATDQREQRKHHPWPWHKEARTTRLVVAAKCAFSLGLAVLLGLLFSSDHGFWAGLIVATTMATEREWTWALAIARAHGTALGSVYGALACLLIDQRRLMELRFLALLPWLILTAGFLKRSRAYGPAGGVAAAVSGIIIVGRRYDEPPMAFTVSRLVETFIGLACTVVADLVFQPAVRPSAKATKQLVRCLATLACCFNDDDSCGGQTSTKVKAVQEQVALLKRYVAEAAGEPHFLWSVPFPASCYDKVAGRLDRMAQLLSLYTRALAVTPPADEAAEAIHRFHGLVSASLEHTSALLHRPSDDEKQPKDLEAGIRLSSCCCDDEEAPETLVQSFLGHALLQQPQQQQGASAMASIGFCMGEMAKDALQMEADMLDLTLCSSLPRHITIIH